MSMSSGSRVRRLGTIAMSSKPYARRPFFPRPISTSMAAILGSAADEPWTLATGLCPIRTVAQSEFPAICGGESARRDRVPAELLDLDLVEQAADLLGVDHAGPEV